MKIMMLFIVSIVSSLFFQQAFAYRTCKSLTRDISKLKPVESLRKCSSYSRGIVRVAFNTEFPHLDKVYQDELKGTWTERAMPQYGYLVDMDYGHRGWFIYGVLYTTNPETGKLSAMIGADSYYACIEPVPAGSSAVLCHNEIKKPQTKLTSVEKSAPN